MIDVKNTDIDLNIIDDYVLCENCFNFISKYRKLDFSYKDYLDAIKNNDDF